MRDVYLEQVRLLVSLLPLIAEESSFALKGGTAINLFHRAIPRLSVDIDLVYVPIAGRDESLRDINQTFDRIADNIREKVRCNADRIAGGGSRRAFHFASLIPGIARSSSTFLKPPFLCRKSTILFARTGPMPGSASNCCGVAVLRLSARNRTGSSFIGRTSLSQSPGPVLES